MDGLNPEILTAILDCIDDGLAVLDQHGDLLYANDEAMRLLATGLTTNRPERWDAQFGVFHEDGITPYTPHNMPLRKALRSSRALPHTRVYTCTPSVPNGCYIDLATRPFAGPMGPAGCVLTLRDVTKLVRANEKLADAARTDPLTGLFNRRALDKAVAANCADDDSFAVVYIDIDGLKRANDSAGHVVGDALIKAAASVLRRSFRVSDVLARVGGDEFAAVVQGAENAVMTTVCGRIEMAVAEHNAMGDTPWPLSLSVGYAIRRAHETTTPAEIIDAADLAMYRLRRQRRRKDAKRGLSPEARQSTH